MRLKQIKVIDPFDIFEFDKVLKVSKQEKSKDPNNYINELFKEGGNRD